MQTYTSYRVVLYIIEPAPQWNYDSNIFRAPTPARDIGAADVVYYRSGVRSFQRASERFTITSGNDTMRDVCRVGPQLFIRL